jgi:hypothetical protein
MRRSGAGVRSSVGLLRFALGSCAEHALVLLRVGCDEQAFGFGAEHFSSV